MKTKSMTATAVLLGLLSACTTTGGHEPQSIPVGEVVEEIKLTLAKVERDAKQQNIEWSFKSAEITLETVLKKGTTTGVNFWIISSEASVSNSVTQQVYYKLMPNDTKAGIAGEEVSLSDQLSGAILKAKIDMMNAHLGGKLIAAESAVVLKFAVEKSVTNAGKVELVPVTLGVKGSRSKSSSHTIKISFT